MANVLSLVALIVLLAQTDSLVGATRSSNDGAAPSLRHLDTYQEDGGSKESSGKSKQTDVKQFELWEPHEFKDALYLWEKDYPDLIRVTTSQEEYGLPRAGGPDDCPFDAKQDGCPNYMFTIQDFIAHPENSSSSSQLPEVFWSGCLHGNERVGPTAVMEAANLLLQAASCEAMPRVSKNKSTLDENESGSGNGNVGVDKSSEVENARKCRKKLLDMGIDDVHRKWLARLVSTRRIVVVPTANALGYYRNDRQEGSVDPNRDFPYDLTDSTKCMRTVAGRTLNEIYREHLFQLALTFHGGMEVVAYEWGAPTWLEHLSPDDEAQSQLAAAYSRFGGGWSTSKPYQFGTMNDMVYYVRGGMEDWAYAGSFDPDRVIPCEPKEFGGYPRSKTTYNNSTLRVFNMLIETSNNKEPKKDELGSSLDVLNRNTPGNGHVSRNIRLALLAVDLVEPWVSIISVNNVALSDDVVPLTDRSGRACQSTKAVMVPQNSRNVVIEWTVGGAIAIDHSELWFAKWDDIPEDQLDCLNQPSSIDGFLKGAAVGLTNGTGVFSRAGSHPSPEKDTTTRTSTGNLPTIGPVFRAIMEIPEKWGKFTEIVVVAGARVDQAWAEQPNNIDPKQPPQSHVVNARTNPNWYHESAGKHIKGRLDWFSVPLTVVVGDYDDSIGTAQGEKQPSTFEMNDRIGGTYGLSGLRPKSAQQGKPAFPFDSWKPFALVLSIGLLVLGCWCSLKGNGRRGRAKKNSNGYGRLGSKSYSDNPGSGFHADKDVELSTLS